VRVTSLNRGKLRFVRLLTSFRPHLVLIRGEGHRSDTRAFRRSVVHLSGQLSIPVERVSNRALVRYFEGLGVHNKEHRASLLARRFIELAWKVPSPRKRWQHEHKNMPIFDAVAIGIAHIQSEKMSGS
jgi:hypothetical protein